MPGGIVKIADVSDFISPSQACILQLPGSDAPDKTGTAAPLVGVHEKRSVDKPKATSASTPREKISVQLRDCLACSGCVTTAETVLIEEQNAAAVLAAMAAYRDSPNNGPIVVTVAPQTLASIAAAFGWSINTTTRRLTRFLRSHGATHVLDSSFARLLALEALADEFKRRTLDSTNIAPSSSSTILAGACPGFVCYVEKRRHEALDAISRTRSPQAIAGALIKRYLSRRRADRDNSWRASRILHVALMPCYDKKLEASRPQFTTRDDDDNREADEATREVDFVITPTELQQPLANFYAANADDHDDDEIEDGEPLDEDEIWLRAFERGRLLADAPAEGSGGYAARIVRVARDHFASRGFESRLDISSDASSSGDMQTTIVQPTLAAVDVVEPRAIVVVKAYGFRNIQNVLRRLRSRRLRADFIEVMACPSGCLNGGGLIRSPLSVVKDDNHMPTIAEAEAPAEQLRRTTAIYTSIDDSSYRQTLLDAARLSMKRWRAADTKFERLMTADVIAAAELPTNSVAALQW